MDIAEFVSDYVQMLRDNGERVSPRKRLAREIAEALKDYGVNASPADVEYYL